MTAAPAPALPRRVLMTADAVGGVWTHALDLAGGLAADGVATVLAVLGPPPDAAQLAQAAAVPGLRLRVTGLPLDWLASGAGEVAGAARAVAALAAEERVDLVHLNTPALAGAADRLPAPVVAACHSCLATWWAAVRGPLAPPMPEDFAWRSAAHGRGLRAADAVVAPTRAFARELAAAHGLPAERVIVVHNGRRPLAGTEAIAAAPPGDFVLGAGRLWDEGKNAATLDRAAARLDRPVLAAGPLRGPHGGAFAPRHLRALGPLDEAALAALLARRPVFASLSRYEPFGLAVLEAAQAGCALVLSDIPGFRELWDGAASFVPAEDDAAAAAALRRLLGDPGLRARMAAAARERSRRYGVAAMAAAMLHRVYAQASAASGRAAGTPSARPGEHAA